MYHQHKDYCSWKMGRAVGPYLQRQVPRYVHMRLVIVHPDLSHPESIPLGVEADVAIVWLLLPLDVGYP